MAQAVADPSKRTWLKAADVCERAQVQAYVLRTWEMEFADLGVVKNPGGRGCTGRRISSACCASSSSCSSKASRWPAPDESSTRSDSPPTSCRLTTSRRSRARRALDADARKRVTAVRNGLRALLTLLSQPRAQEQTGDDAHPGGRRRRWRGASRDIAQDHDEAPQGRVVAYERTLAGRTYGGRNFSSAAEHYPPGNGT